MAYCTVGSGLGENTGTQATGTPTTSMVALGEIGSVLDLVINHALGLHLPERRALSGLVADLARAVVGDSAPTTVVPLMRWALAAASRPFLPIRAPKPVERALAHLVLEHDMIGKGDIAALVDHADMAAAVTVSVFWS